MVFFWFLLVCLDSQQSYVCSAQIVWLTGLAAAVGVGAAAATTLQLNCGAVQCDNFGAVLCDNFGAVQCDNFGAV